MFGRKLRRRLAILIGLVTVNVGSVVPDGCQDYLRFANPCAGAGNIFSAAVCTRADWEDFFDGFQPNYDRDPFCTLPGTCPGNTTSDPSAGDGQPGVPGGTIGLAG